MERLGIDCFYTAEQVRDWIEECDLVMESIHNSSHGIVFEVYSRDPHGEDPGLFLDLYVSGDKAGLFEVFGLG